MARQMIVLVVLLVGLGALHMVGTHRPLAAKPAASTDSFAWLGTLPARMEADEIGQRWDRLLKRMERDARAVDVRRFVCRSPAEVGALPMMGAVMRYMDAQPGSEDDKTLAGGLMKAAAQGNWLARTLMLPPLDEADEAGDAASRYRSIQLAEWMYRNRFGQVYSALEPRTASLVGLGGEDGNDPSGFLAAAAMQQDFGAQRSVGRVLVGMDDPESIAAGGRMLACAARARAAYMKMSEANDHADRIAWQSSNPRQESKYPSTLRGSGTEVTR